METCAQLVHTMTKIDVNSCRTGTSQHSPPISTRVGEFLNRLLLFVGTIVEYLFGMHIGAVAGWLAGLCLANTYVEYFEPVYMNDLTELYRWRLMPGRYAITGATIGLLIGAVAIALIKNKLLAKRIAALQKQNITDPAVLARRLGTSETQIQRTPSKLTKNQKTTAKNLIFQKDYQLDQPILIRAYCPEKCKIAK